ncbi:MAG TPA: DUF1616 domain-containing protein [Solirubrobacterales bacterium]|nr:DUF1616 domain-containing protein [Solirubrobacterales bacterium]
MSPRAPNRVLDLRLACGLAAIGLIGTLVSPGGWLQAVLLSPLVLVATGYAITAALFPPGATEREDRYVHVFVFSVSAAALGGLLVQFAVDLDRAAWIAISTIVTFGASAIAARRRQTTPIQRRRSAPLRAPAGALWAVGFLAALVIAGAAVAIATDGVHEQQSRQRFASLWGLPVGTGIEAGVWNHGGPTTYRLDLSDGDELLESLRLRLSTHERWSKRLGATVAGRTGTLLLTLYHDALPYRSVELDLEEPE